MIERGNRVKINPVDDAYDMEYLMRKQKMTLEEWRSTHPEGAAQYDKPISWFKDHVKCCYNCSNWYRDPMLMGEYKYNSCLAHKDHITVWDAFCDDWFGFADGKEENLLDFIKREWSKSNCF